MIELNHCPKCGGDIVGVVSEDVISLACDTCFYSIGTVYTAKPKDWKAWKQYAGGETMNEELKPCPFCGGEAGVCIDDKDLENLRYGVMCLNPDCAIWGWFEFEDEAIASWNRRVQA